MPSTREELTVTISSGTALSAAVNLGERTLQGIVMPAAWDAAGLSFQVSVDGSTFVDLQERDGTEYTATVDAGEGILIPPDDFAAWSHIKVRSGTAATGVNQTADRDLTLVVVHR